MSSEMEPFDVDPKIGEVMSILDSLLWEAGAPSWNDEDAVEVRRAYETISRLEIDNQVAFLRHCALKIRSTIIEREIAQEIEKQGLLSAWDAGHDH